MNYLLPFVVLSLIFGFSCGYTFKQTDLPPFAFIFILTGGILAVNLGWKGIL